ncbi:hypothetical protein [Streptomyces sp. URMC 124]|uniref:hypothetical protein n=1 Tax=Streptomyces sp. URMC 124 TaxID=3423405 RepID=UPI003F1B6D7D
MTDAHEGPAEAGAEDRAPYVVAMLVLTLLFLTPAIGLWVLELQSVRHPGTGAGSARFGAVIVGAPAAGALLGGAAAVARRRRGGPAAATGAFLGAIGLCAYGVRVFSETFQLLP